MNFYEEEILETIRSHIESGEVLVSPDSSGIFRALEMSFPLDSSRIDWSLVPGAVRKFGRKDDEGREFENFFREIVVNKGLRGNVTYVGDGNTEFSLTCPIDTMLRIAPVIVSAVPQHHYFVGENGDWCASFMSEGEMAFGFSQHRDG